MMEGLSPCPREHHEHHKCCSPLNLERKKCLSLLLMPLLPCVTDQVQPGVILTDILLLPAPEQSRFLFVFHGQSV